jgi:hypothetical protein
MSLIGASDPLSDDEERRIVGFLRTRLTSWQPTHRIWARYDKAFRELVLAALAEYDSERPGIDPLFGPLKFSS